jgi:glutathione peroxidase
MRKFYFLSMILIVPIILLLNSVFSMKDPAGGSSQTKGTMKSIYDITVKDIEGQTFKLDRYQGKAMLIVNVASQCGYTPQYEGLESVYRKYQAKGLIVLGFPANNFGGQEPGTDAEIKTFCSTRYNVTFPIFSKVSADGSDVHPLYKFLTEKETNPQFAGKITWNFNKFLVDKTGRLIARFDSSDKPESTEVTQSIEQALKD